MKGSQLVKKKQRLTNERQPCLLPPHRLWQPSHYNGVLQQKLYDTQARDIYYLAFTGGLLTFVIREVWGQHVPAARAI